VTGVYAPFVLGSDYADPDLLSAAQQRRFAAQVPGWQPVVGNPEVALLGVTALAWYDLGQRLSAAAADALSGYGTLLQVRPVYATPATLVATWTVADPAGHVIPGGTQVAWTGSPDGQGTTFTLPAPLTVPAGQTQVAGVLLVADTPGVAGNGVPAGPLELQDASLAFVTGVAATSPATGGADSETADAYRARVAATMTTLTKVPVHGRDYARLALDVVGVARALAVKGWDPAAGTTGVPACVAVVPLTSAGLPVPSGVAAALTAYLDGLREVNTLVRVTSPAYVQVRATVRVIAAPGADPTAVQTAVAAAAAGYLSPAGWDTPAGPLPSWGGRTVLLPLDLAAALARVPGVDKVDTLDVNGVGVTPLDLGAGLPATQRYAVLPAGTAPNPAWPTPSTVTVTVLPAGSSGL